MHMPADPLQHQAECVTPPVPTPAPVNRWVGIDVAMEALNVTERRAYKLAKSEGWRTALGVYPRQFAFDDIIRTDQKRKATTS